MDVTVIVFLEILQIAKLTHNKKKLEKAGETRNYDLQDENEMQ